MCVIAKELGCLHKQARAARILNHLLVQASLFLFLETVRTDNFLSEVMFVGVRARRAKCVLRPSGGAENAIKRNRHDHARPMKVYLPE